MICHPTIIYSTYWTGFHLSTELRKSHWKFYLSNLSISILISFSVTHTHTHILIFWIYNIFTISYNDGNNWCRPNETMWTKTKYTYLVMYSLIVINLWKDLSISSIQNFKSTNKKFCVIRNFSKYRICGCVCKGA